ncbi:MAG TPA: GGDEF domain-containing protein [Kofleriaceae bacterium]|nr:GGDEF domain-containing protein [Kofleriaceae bacterium]
MAILSGLRERRTLGQLSQELRGSRERTLMLADATASLIACVKALALDIEEIGAPALKLALDETLAALRAEAPSDHLAGAIAARRTEALEFAGREREYLATRDAELYRIIQVLRDGLAVLSDGDDAFNQRMLDRGTRLEAASQLDDLVRVRQAISREVIELRRQVADKQASDEARTAELTREVDTLRRDVEHARVSAATDKLTGAANRAAFDSELARLIELAGDGHQGFALLLADIDHFKAINDTHGHPVGDRVLIGFVAFCRSRVRRGDMVARWGGEEIAILLPAASQRIAHRVAVSLLEQLAAQDWLIETGDTIRFTASIGVGAWESGDTADTLLARTDEALYSAKQQGRNRAIRAGSRPARPRVTAG